jgi:hypothetical protein
MKKNEVKKFSKSNLPVKICAYCGKPMHWRKRWAKVWAEVKFCSERCRRGKNQTNFA